jgi:predicted acyl esterase
VSETNVFIPMADGVRLAATLYMPETTGPWPALVEAYPYRKDDVSVWADDYRRLRDEGDYVVCRSIRAARGRPRASPRRSTHRARPTTCAR